MALLVGGFCWLGWPLHCLLVIYKQCLLILDEDLLTAVSQSRGALQFSNRSSRHAFPKSSGFSFWRISCHFFPCFDLSSGSSCTSICLANDPGASPQGYIWKKLYIEHGDVFFYLMPSNREPQRAVSNRAHEQLVIVF